MINGNTDAKGEYGDRERRRENPTNNQQMYEM